MSAGGRAALREDLASAPVIALAGNPNVGKSTVFNALTGMKQHTGNWPGKTVGSAVGEVSHGGRQYTIVDLPGAYSLDARSAEEQVARDFILGDGFDAVIIVCDATCLGRSLIFALQVLAAAPRAVVCVNLIDEAEKNGRPVDLVELQRQLGVPVIGTAARSGRGLDALMDAAARQCAAASQCGACAGCKSCGACAEARCFDGLDGVRRAHLAERIAQSAQRDGGRTARDTLLDRLFTGRLTGIPMMLLLLGFILWLTLSGANAPSRLLASALLRVEEWLTALFELLDATHWLHGALVLGAYRVLAWVVAVMLPPMAIFFPLFTLLEDFGYLPRVAFNLDGGFSRAGACGKQALTMCMGLGCNAAAVTGCRIIDSPRERLIAILTNSFMPCNGRFPTLIAISGMFFASSGVLGAIIPALMLPLLIVLGVALTLLFSRLLSRTILRGTPSSFALELPPYRTPKLKSVIVRSLLDRTVFVLSRAAAVAAPCGLLIWTLANINVGDLSLLAHLCGALDPFGRALGLDGVILLAFILGLPANEIIVPIIVMTYISGGSLAQVPGLEELKTLLVANGWTWMTAVSAVLFCMAHWPCSTTLLTIRREAGGWKWAALGMALPTASGVLMCFTFTCVTKILGLR